MDDRGNIWTEEQLKELAKTDKKKLDELGKLIEIIPEQDKEVFDMNNEERRNWYQKMANKRREFPLPK